MLRSGLKMTIRAQEYALGPTTLILGWLLFLVAAVLSSETICDSDTQYPIRKNSKIVGCRPCHDCLKGFEPVILCGTVIDDNDSVGYCRPCGNGTFSPTNDQRPCRICQKPTCLEHEKVHENCTDTFDASHCTGSCDNGFEMNKKRTKCELHDPQKNSNTTTQLLPISTTNQPQHTTKNLVPMSNENGEKDVLPVVAIVFIIIGSVLFIFILIIALCWFFNKMHKVNPRGNRCVNGSPSTSTELLDIENGKLIKEEDGEGNGAPVMSKPHCCETGFGSETPDDSNSVTDTSASDTPLHGQVAFDMQVTYPDSMMSVPLKSPAPVPPLLPAQPQMMNARPVPVLDHVRPVDPVLVPARQEVQNMVPAARHRAQPIAPIGIIHNPPPDMTRFEKWPKKIYDDICRTFNNSVAPGKDWDALASNLDFTVEQAREFANKKNKTDALVSSWMARRENNVAKFVTVLNNMDMTYLADSIHHICVTNRYY